MKGKQVFLIAIISALLSLLVLNLYYYYKDPSYKLRYDIYVYEINITQKMFLDENITINGEFFLDAKMNSTSIGEMQVIQVKDLFLIKQENSLTNLLRINNTGEIDYFNLYNLPNPSSFKIFSLSRNLKFEMSGISNKYSVSIYSIIINENSFIQLGGIINEIA